MAVIAALESVPEGRRRMRRVTNHSCDGRKGMGDRVEASADVVNSLAFVNSEAVQ